MDSNPQQADPTFRATQAERNYKYTRGALTARTPIGDNQVLEWSTQLNYQDLDHPLPFAIIDDTTYSWSSELRLDAGGAAARPRQSRPAWGCSTAGTRQNDDQFQNLNGERGVQVQNQINSASNYATLRREPVRRHPHLHGGGGPARAVRGAQRDTTSSAPIARTRSTSARSRRSSGSCGRLAPGAQVYGNASHAYEPPLILELTAPGQIGGDLSQLKAQRAWQFEIGTRGAWNERVTWDIAIYDIELWDEIQNVNVQPFPGAPFTIPRFQNIRRSRHTGAEAGLDVLLLRDLLRRVGLGTHRRRACARASPTPGHTSSS